MQTIQQPNPSRIFIPEQGNPGIATMNINAIPHSYLAGNQPDHRFPATAPASGMMAAPLHQQRVHEYNNHDDTCMSATSSFNIQNEEDCFSPDSTHSAATSFCEVSSPDTSGHLESYYYTHQLPQQVVPAPSPMTFGHVMMAPDQDRNNGFAATTYQYNPYL